MKHLIFIPLAFYLLTAGCSTQNILSQYEGTEIVFGKGGGVTGQVSEYTLNTSGQIILTEKISNKQQSIVDLKKGATKELYTQLSEINFSNINFNHPGNIYYFVREVKGDKTHEVVWGSPDQNVPTLVEDFYNSLMSKVK